jgi:phosphoribosylformimino-5-aminoimidazole carboxamide ribotide isomerase
MILVIPAIELSDGRCCDRIKGENGTENLYNLFKNNPCELIKLWRRENAKSVHINDIDSFIHNSGQVNINGIIYLTELTDIPLSLAHNFKETELCRIFLNSGIYRLFIGKLFISNNLEVASLVSEFTPSRVAAYIDADDDFAYYDSDDLKLPIDDMISLVKQSGANRILYSNRTWNDSINDADIENIKKIAEKHKVRITINGGISSPQDLWRINKLSKYGIDSTIMSRPLYSNSFPCQKIWRMVEAELEPKILYNNH